jgi:hypothetical protein
MIVALAPPLLVVLLLALLAGGAVQVAAGRSDSRRGHLFMSGTFWGLLLSGAVGLHLALSWAFGATPRDLTLGRFTRVDAAPRGSYFALQLYGWKRLGYWPAFLVDARAGGFAALGGAESLSQIAFARDGRHAAWIRLGRRRALCSADLDGPAPRLSTVPLPALPEFDEYSSVLALSASGERLLQRSPGLVRAFETGTGRLVAQSPVPGVSQGSFDSTERVWLYRRLDTSRPGAGIAILEWNLRTGLVVETGRIEDAVWISGSRDGRLLVPTTRGGLALRDAESGRLLRTLLPADIDGPPLQWPSVRSRFLSDGRVASIVAEKDGARLRVFSSGGDPLVDVVVGRSRHILLGGESAPGELLIFEAWADPASATYFIDAATGEVRGREDGITPAIWHWPANDPQDLGIPGSLETRLFIGPDGTLVDRDPATGARRVLIQGDKAQRG